MIDPQRLADELEADRDVLRSLSENGDVNTIVRPVDLHFKGARQSIKALADDAEELGFRFVALNEHEDGEWSVDLQIDITTEYSSIEKLTRQALEIEASHDVESDGWGCSAETGSKH